MTSVFVNVAGYSKYNLSESESDIQIFINEYKDRIKTQLEREEENKHTPFISFAEKKGFYSPEEDWIQTNYEKFFKDTPNEFLAKTTYLTGVGYICSAAYSPDGTYIIVGHSTGLIQMRHGLTGTVLCTLRNCQFPPKPVHSLEYSKLEERVCYAACTDGCVYRIEVPDIDISLVDPPEFCIRADPALECLNTQFFGGSGTANYVTPHISQRPPALAMSLTSDQSNMVVGYGDTSIKVFDMETKEAVLTYKVHKLRLQFIPKKLQRMHCGQVCALRCHPEKPFCFASGAWDNTLRVWDMRCPVGCMMTFEGVNICHDSIDLNREHVISGSWQPTEALSLWDLTARKRISIIRVQNRRFDVDEEYIYACRYWRSAQYNRKGKYGIIGGSGTKCVEVINLHNRYISCSYPALGTTLAVTSYGERIAFGGTAPVFTIVQFRDPKHEKYVVESDSDFDYTKAEIIYDDDKNTSTTVVPSEPFSDANLPELKKSKTSSTAIVT